MQEIVILLSSIAGICTAAAVKRFPKNKTHPLNLGANSHIKNQINTLRLEKDILTKTITRLYQGESEVSKIKSDKLLVSYHHQLGIILAKIEKLERANKHPDLGPVGDGLITLMDQKLSQLDQRLYEITSKVTSTNNQIKDLTKESIEPENNIESHESIKIAYETKDEPKKAKLDSENKSQQDNIPSIKFTAPKEHKPMELTTLTEIPSKSFEFPLIKQKPIESKTEIVHEIIKPQEKIEEKIEIIQSSVSPSSLYQPETSPEPKKQETTFPTPAPQEMPKPEETKPKPTVRLPEEEKLDDDEDDIEKIKVEIMKTLSKLEQAEVE